MKLKRYFCGALTLLITISCIFTLSGCKREPITEYNPVINPLVKHDKENYIGYQLELPEIGEPVAVLTTNYGTITIRLFPENAPKAVENFIALANDGKYNNVPFHRAINDFAIQTGDYENGDGTGGTSSFGENFEDEFCDTLYNIRGAVAMANSGINTNGSQFYINQATPAAVDREYIEQMYYNYTSQYEKYCDEYGNKFVKEYPDMESFVNNYCGGVPLATAIPEEVWSLYETYGGNIHLDGACRTAGGNTVFGQVISGMEVVDAIAAAEVDERNTPVTDIILQSVTIEQFSGQ